MIFNFRRRKNILKMKLSTKGANFIKKEEGGCRLNAYKCQAGVSTIGYGHAFKVSKNMRITKEEAERFFRSDIARCEEVVKKYVNVKLKQHEFDALISFIFNTGPYAFPKSTMLKLINKKEFSAAAEEFKKWKYGNGRVLPILVRRRKRERILFLGL